MTTFYLARSEEVDYLLEEIVADAIEKIEDSIVECVKHAYALGYRQAEKDVKNKENRKRKKKKGK